MAQSGLEEIGEGCPLSGVKRTLTRRCATAALRSGQFSLKRGCDSSMPSLDSAFCGVGVAIDYLKVWQAPKIKQLRPRQITVFAPHSK
jgi:hypothetical protein